MPKQLRCDESVSAGYDPTGENAVTCGALALRCADCGDAAGCEEHAQYCPHCGKPICASCETEHACAMDEKRPAVSDQQQRQRKSA